MLQKSLSMRSEQANENLKLCQKVFISFSPRGLCLFLFSRSSDTARTRRTKGKTFKYINQCINDKLSIEMKEQKERQLERERERKEEGE